MPETLIEIINVVFTMTYGILSLVVAILNLWISHKIRVERSANAPFEHVRPCISQCRLRPSPHQNGNDNGKCRVR